MNTWKLILLINLLGAAKEINSESAILPLILLRVSATYLYPKHVDRMITNNGIISSGTKFSSWYDKEKCKQIFFCPLETSSGINCLYPKKFENGDVLKCDTEPSPFVEKMTYKDDTTGQVKDLPCSLTDREGVWYKTGYKVCVPVPPKMSAHQKILFRFAGWTIKPTNDCSEFRVFEFCYDEKNKEVLYTDHVIRSPKFFTDGRFKNELEKTFEIISNGYGSFGSIYQNDKNIYEQLVSSEQSEYTGQWLVPPEDLVFALWRKTAFNYLNMKPMRKDQLKLWNYINNCVKKESIKINKEFTVYTAAIVLPEKAQPSYVIESIKKPDVWIKLVFHFYTLVTQMGNLNKSSGLAIVMNSNLDEDALEEFYKYCPTNRCENVFNKKFPVLGNTVRCCDFRDVKKLFNIEFRINNGLEIDFSPDDSPDEGNRDVFIHQAIYMDET